MAAAPRLRSLIYGTPDVPFDSDSKEAKKQLIRAAFMFRDFCGNTLYFTYPEFWAAAEEYGKREPQGYRGAADDYAVIYRFKGFMWARVKAEKRSWSTTKRIPGYRGRGKKGFGLGTIGVAIDAANGGRS